MNDIERNSHLAGNSARDWIGLAAVAVLLAAILFGFGSML